MIDEYTLGVYLHISGIVMMVFSTFKLQEINLVHIIIHRVQYKKETVNEQNTGRLHLIFRNFQIFSVQLNPIKNQLIIPETHNI